MFSRYGNPKMCKPEYKPFAEAFKRDCSCTFLQSYMRLLSVLPAGGYLPDRIVNLAQYLTTALASSNTYKMIKPDMDAVVFQIVFPRYATTPRTRSCGRTTRTSISARGYDIIEDMYSPRTAAMNFLCELCSKRTKDNMPKVMGFLVQILTRCAETPAAQQPHAELGEGACTPSALFRISSSPPPDTRSSSSLCSRRTSCSRSRPPHGHVRAKAAWCAGVYAEIEFANPQNFMSLFGSVVKLEGSGAASQGGRRRGARIFRRGRRRHRAASTDPPTTARRVLQADERGGERRPGVHPRDHRGEIRGGDCAVRAGAHRQPRGGVLETVRG